MEKRENRNRNGSHRRPAVVYKDIRHARNADVRAERSARGINHNEYRDNYFIRGKTENKREQNCPVKSHYSAHGVKKIRRVGY